MTSDQITREVHRIADTGGNANTTQVLCLCALALVWAIREASQQITDAIDRRA